MTENLHGQQDDGKADWLTTSSWKKKSCFPDRQWRSLIRRRHSSPFPSSSPNDCPASQWERGAGWQDGDTGGREALLERCSALLPTPPLGPAQPPQQGRPKPGGEAAERQSFPADWKCLAGSTQVLFPCVITLDQGWVNFLTGGPQWVTADGWSVLVTHLMGERTLRGYVGHVL